MCVFHQGVPHSLSLSLSASAVSQVRDCKETLDCFKK